MANDYVERSMPTAIPRISWAAILAGLAFALAIQLLLSLLGIGIGASTVHPTSPNGASAGNVGIGSIIWFIITSLIALFAGGWIAGRLAGIPRQLDGALHGLLTWSLMSLFTIYIIASGVGSVLGGAAGALGSVMSAAGSGAAAVAPGIAKNVSDQAQAQASKAGVSTDSITAKVQQLLRETGNAKLTPESLKAQSNHQAALAKNAAEKTAADPQSAAQTKNDLVYRFLHDTGATSKSADRQDLINVVASEQHVSKSEAAKTVDGWSQEAQQAQQQAQQLQNEATQKVKEAGDATASSLSKAAIAAFFLFLVGAVAAAFGGMISARSLTEETANREVIRTAKNI